MEKKSVNLLLVIKIITLHLNFVLEAYPWKHKFVRVDIEEVSFKGSGYDFSVDYNAIDKSNILNIHKI